MHSKGIVHRDVKLENIMVEKDGYLKLIDYGLATVLKEDQFAQEFCGTYEYLAPEILKRQAYDKSVDWWSYGILLYEMLIGITPFTNSSRQTIFKKILNNKPILPNRKKYNIKYTDELMSLIEQLLNKDPSTRLGSKDDFEEVLAHPFFKDIDRKELLNKTMAVEATSEELNDSLSCLKNIGVMESEVPSAKQILIEKNKKEFEAFDKK